MTAMNPWSAAPCTVGAKRRLTLCTPRPVNSSARFSLPPRGECGPWAEDTSSSVAAGPCQAATPDANRNGRSVPASASQMVWTAARSAALEAAGLEKSCLFARWMTASASSAPARTPRDRRGDCDAAMLSLDRTHSLRCSTRSSRSDGEPASRTAPRAGRRLACPVARQQALWPGCAGISARRCPGRVELADSRGAKHRPQSRRTDLISETGQLAVQLAVAPRRVLRRQAQHQVADLLASRGALWPRAGPLGGNETAVPGQQRSGTTSRLSRSAASSSCST